MTALLLRIVDFKLWASVAKTDASNFG